MNYYRAMNEDFGDDTDTITDNQLDTNDIDYSIGVHRITFYKYDDDGNELLNENGTTKEFELSCARFKPLEYLCEDLTCDDVEEIT